MKSDTGCGIKLREKLCSYVWLASQTTSWATATLRRSAAITRRNRPGPNLAAPTWPSNSCVSICAGAIPAMSASRTGCSTCPSKQNPEFTHEKTADYVEAGYDHTTKSCGAGSGARALSGTGIQGQWCRLWLTARTEDPGPQADPAIPAAAEAPVENTELPVGEALKCSQMSRVNYLVTF